MGTGLACGHRAGTWAQGGHVGTGLARGHRAGTDGRVWIHCSGPGRGTPAWETQVPSVQTGNRLAEGQTSAYRGQSPREAPSEGRK